MATERARELAATATSPISTDLRNGASSASSAMSP
jgi:hypothetical protein